MLGETSLERKCRFLFGGCLLVLITSSFWWYGQRTEKLVYESSREAARASVKIERFNPDGSPLRASDAAEPPPTPAEAVPPPPENR